MLRRLLFVLIFIFCAVPAIAARTFYIDYANGADTNSGTDKTHPWKRVPGMPGCVNACASTTPSADDTFFLKGGVTWPSDVLPLQWRERKGAPDHPITLGADRTWYNGSSFTKPVFDGEYVAGAILDLIYVSYIAVDNIEFKRVMCPTANVGGLIRFQSVSHLTFTNLYLHGWRLAGSGQRADDAQGGIIGLGAAYPNNTTDAPTVSMTDSVIENSENTGNQSGLAARYVGVMTRVTIHDVQSAVLFTIDWNGGTLYNISYPAGNVGPDPNFHANGVYMDPATLGQTAGYIRNSIFHDTGAGANMAFPNVRAGTTAYVYNNIFYGAMSGQDAISVDPYQYAGEGPGNAFIANNLCYMPDSGRTVCIHAPARGAQKIGNLTIINNHIIGTNVSLDDSSSTQVSGTLTRLTNLTQTPSAAKGQGYVQTTQWKPMSSDGSTVGKGTDESKVFTTTISGGTRAAPWDIGPYQH